MLMQHHLLHKRKQVDNCKPFIGRQNYIGDLLLSYDLTSFLTTVAASSASIVAILGGFIASKLISISSERSNVIDKLKAIEKELSFKQTEIISKQEKKDKEDALTFIRFHLEDLIEEHPLDIVYDIAENQCITINRLEPYWNKAMNLFHELCEAYPEEANNAEYNSDDLPKEIARKYSEDSFSYAILESIVNFMKKRVREEKRKKLEEERKNNFLLNSLACLDLNYSDLTEPLQEVNLISSPWNYAQNEQDIARLDTDIKYLEFQKKQLQEQKTALTKPKGMRTGLIIFALFSIACIIAPLAMSPRYFDKLFDFWRIKLIILFLFFSGMVSIFLYLVYLLNWKEDL